MESLLIEFKLRLSGLIWLIAKSLPFPSKNAEFESLPEGKSGAHRRARNSSLP